MRWKLESQSSEFHRFERFAKENDTVRKVIRLRKRELESIEDYMRRAESAVSNAMHRYQILSWDSWARRTIFRWAGWVARLQFFDADRLTLAVLRHKNIKWLRLIQDQNHGSQLHGRCLRVWRWETMLWNFFAENSPGESWEEIALDSERWKSYVDQVV